MIDLLRYEWDEGFIAIQARKKNLFLRLGCRTRYIVYNPVQYIVQCKPEKFEKTTNPPHISHNVVSSTLAMSGIRTYNFMQFDCSKRTCA
jgi:hypothetical protein